MSENSISLGNASVGGNFTGRDDNSISFHNTADRSMYLHDLYEKFQKEKEHNQELKDFCEELDYLNSIIDDEVIGLEQKLIDGDRESILHYAKEVKERFHKNFVRTSQYSLIAQDINVYLLTKVRRGFMMEIYGLICKKESEQKINLLITERIINPVKADLGINLFRYNEDDIVE